jgi:serine/threonine protein kinase
MQRVATSHPRKRGTVPVQYNKTEAPLLEPGQDDGRKRSSIPGRGNALKAGTVLQNRYRVLEVRGVGGMSTVYKARDLRFTSVDRQCAIKEMFNSAEDAKMRSLRLANFQREASLLATLTHSAIPRIYDYFEQQGTIYLVLELIHGEDLETLLSENGMPFEQSQILDWGLALCSVISYLHNQKPEPIIFRDLKPSNIMIRKEDNALMLVDFGIARSFAPQQKGTMIGTEGYAPPEQYKGIADARGDIYALGATLHHLATGSDPRSETPFTFGQRPPRKLNPALSPQFEELILRCVAYSPNDRPQSAEDVRHILEQIKYATYAKIDEAAPAVTIRTVEAVAADERERSAGSRMLGDSDQLAENASIDPGASSRSSSAPLEPELVHEVKPTIQPDEVLEEKRLDWTVKTSEEIRGSASFAGGSIYVGSYDGNVYSIDDSDGSVRWRFKTQSGIVSKPAIQSEMVIFGSEDKTIYAVSRSSGRAIWSFRTNDKVRSSPFVDDKSVLVGSDDGHLYRLDRQKGVVTWRYRTFAPVRSSPVCVDDKVVFGSDDGFLYTVNRESGSLLWRVNVDAPVMSTPAIAGDRVVIGVSDGSIRGFALRDGKSLWQHTSRKAVLASAVIDNEVAYIGSADGHMYAINITTGKQAWRSQVCRQITSSAVIDGNKLLVGGNDAVFYCLNKSDGSVLWTFGTGGAIVARPVLTNDHIVFGSLDGSIYALVRG